MKEKIKLVIVFIIGIMISVVISVTVATVITGKEVSYSSSTSEITYNGVAASNVQDAIDKVYTSANTLATDVSGLKSKIKITQLYDSFTWATTINSWTYVTIPNLSKYEMVVFKYRVSDCNRTAVLVNGIGNIRASCYIKSTLYGSGQVSFDFSNNRVGLCPEYGNVANGTIGLSYVYGIQLKD